MEARSSASRRRPARSRAGAGFSKSKESDHRRGFPIVLCGPYLLSCRCRDTSPLLSGTESSASAAARDLSALLMFAGLFIIVAGTEHALLGSPDDLFKTAR